MTPRKLNLIAYNPQAGCDQLVINVTIISLKQDGKEKIQMVEPLLCGIVLGLIPITLAGLFVAAYEQYQRGKELEF